MRGNKVRILIYGLILVVIVALGWTFYSSSKSTKEVPKRAKLVECIELNLIMG